MSKDILRTVSKQVGINALLVHALSEEAVYTRSIMELGFPSLRAKRNPHRLLRRCAPRNDVRGSSNSVTPNFIMERVYFYKAHGFVQSPLDCMTLMLTLKEAGQYLWTLTYFGRPFEW